MTKKLKDVVQEPAGEPTDMNQVDRLTMQMMNERTGRLEAQLQVLVTQHAQVKSEFDKASKERESFRSVLKDRYKLNDEDTIDLVSGKITRKK